MLYSSGRLFISAQTRGSDRSAETSGLDVQMFSLLFLAVGFVAAPQVVGVEDPRMGEEVCACLKLQDGQECTAEEIRAFCRGQVRTGPEPLGLSGSDWTVQLKVVLLLSDRSLQDSSLRPVCDQLPPDHYWKGDFCFLPWAADYFYKWIKWDVIRSRAPPVNSSGSWRSAWARRLFVSTGS